MDLLKSDRVGKGVWVDEVKDAGNSSPKRHCPQKAVAAQAATTASNGASRSRASINCVSV